MMSRKIPDIEFVDEKWIVVFKPPGWYSIPPRPLSDGKVDFTPVLNTWLAKQLKHDVFVVHRLDRETTGVMLFAKTESAHKLACDWFEKGEVKKTYHCIGVGQMNEPMIRVDKDIDGKKSITQIELKEKFKTAVLTECRPVTGRTHQIRVHMSEIGCPILGDKQYGGPSEIEVDGFQLQVDRVALHASKLELPTGEKFEDPWPEDFHNWVEVLRGGNST